MTDARTFLDAVLGAVLDAMAPLEDALADQVLLEQLLAELGWVVDPGPVPAGQLQARIPVGTLITTLRATVESIRTGAATPELYAELTRGTSELVGLLGALAAGAPPALPVPLSQQEFWDSLAADLVGYLVTRRLREASPTVYALLHLAGIIDLALAPAADSRLAGHRRTVLRWDRLGRMLTDPAALLAEVYGWGATFAHGELLERLETVLRALGVWTAAVEYSGGTAEIYYGDPESPPAPASELRILLGTGTTAAGLHAEAGLAVAAIPAVTGVPGPAAGLLVSLYAEGGVEVAFPLSDSVTARLVGVVDADRLIGVELRPGGAALADAAAVSARAGVALEYRPPAPVLLFGGREGTRAQLSGATFGFLAEAGPAGFDVAVRAELAGFTVVVSLADADAFLGGLLGDGALTLAADLNLVLSLRDGLRVDGRAELRLAIPLALALGPVTLQRLELAAGTDGTAVLFFAAITAAGKLGPLGVTVDGIGAALRLAPDPNGAAAGLTPTLAFRPPRGVGLVITAPTISGGGFLLCDPDRGEYAGVLALKFSGIALSAIGIITTRPGEFSLLVIISVAFSPIQLGYGFTLNGVGGLLALNRTIDLRAISDGLAHGALDAFLFPPDPVGNAPQLIAALNRYFPPKQGQFVFGPSVVLGWGTPTLLTITLGVLIELPSPLRIVLAGILRMVLPDPKTAVASITVDVLGSLDLTNQRLEIDAGLRDSRVAGFTLTGDLAVRASWGREPGFLLAAGGFHPRTRAPGGVRTLQRLAIALGTGDNPRLRLEAYLALTSNTVQFGARLDLYAGLDIGIGKFSITATVGFDALIQFSPFRFEVDIYASVALRWNDDPFLGVALRATLSGPQPWHACGEASFTFLGTHTVQFEITVGAPPPPQPVEVIDVTELLSAALLDPRNWEAQHPADARRGMVTLRPRPAAEPGLVVHPLGTLTVRQQVVPLLRTITRFGAGRPDATLFALTLRAPDGSIRTPEAVEGPFARAQYLDLNDAEKLAAPAFDDLPCGGRYSDGGRLLPSAGVHDYGPLTYEERLLDVEDAAPGPPTPRRLDEADLPRLALAGAVAVGGATGTRDARLLGRPAGVDTRPMTFRLLDLGAMAGAGGEPGAFGVAADELRRRLAAEPDLVHRLAVVGSHEAQA